MSLSVCAHACGCVAVLMYARMVACLHVCLAGTYVHIRMYGAGLPHPPSPPTPWYPPLPVKWVVVLFGLVAFFVWSCLASSPPPPVEWGLWSFWLAPPRLWGAVCSTEVWYGCCRLLAEMSSLHALSPPPPVGWACGRFGWPRPSVFYRDMVWLLPLVSSNVIATCSLPL